MTDIRQEGETVTLAWHGRPELKAEVLERMRKHREHDTIIQGLYQEADPELATKYRGCLIGCTLPLLPKDDPDTNWWEEVERLYGIEWRVAKLLDQVFESLTPADCAAFAVEAIEVIPVGADLSDTYEQYEDHNEDLHDGDYLLQLLREATVPEKSDPVGA